VAVPCARDRLRTLDRRPGERSPVGFGSR